MSRSTEALRQQLLLGALWRQAPDAALNGWLRDAPARAERGLAAYRANGAASAGRALAAAYPRVATAIGDEALAALARRLWRSCPPALGDLAQWGEGLAALIATEAPLAEWPWLADLARLDWAVHQAEMAADTPLAADHDYDPDAEGAAGPERGPACRHGPAGGPADAPPAPGNGLPPGLDGLAEADAAARRLQLRPGMQLLCSDWPLAALWLAHREPGGEVAAGEPSGDVAAPQPGGDLAVRVAEVLAQGAAQAALVSRAGWRAEVQAVAPDDARFMAAVLAGASLGDALAAAGEAFAFEPWLLHALRQGWITALLPPAAAAPAGDTAP